MRRADSRLGHDQRPGGPRDAGRRAEQAPWPSRPTAATLSGGADQTVRLWHMGTGKELCRFFGHLNYVDCVAFSPDGRFALSGGGDKTVRLWRLPK